MLLKGFYLFGLCLLAFPSGLALSAEQESYTYNAACTAVDTNGIDWDTLFFCTGGTLKRAPYFFGTSIDSCDSSHAGIVQWNGSALLYCNGTAWITFRNDPILGNNSSATAPYRQGEMSTGLYTPATGVIAASAGGSEAFRITSNRYVGIGTASPVVRLDVHGGVKIGNSVTCDSNRAGTLRWTGTQLQLCTGVKWIFIASD